MTIKEQLKNISIINTWIVLHFIEKDGYVYETTKYYGTEDLYYFTETISTYEVEKTIIENGEVHIYVKPL